MSKGTSTVKMTDDSRPIKKQNIKQKRGMTDDVTQTYVNVSWIMNSSTVINLTNKGFTFTKLRIIHSLI